jgi:polar amino acid transport system substrate-binding protein
MQIIRRACLAVAGAAVLATLVGGAARADDAAVPPAGVSKRIDDIHRRGSLRVGALGEFPWLKENAGGSGDPFAGPAWALAGEYAHRLGVKLEVVPVSHETKVPILATGQVDITIAPLSVTPTREKVVDFIVYSSSALCFFGQASNPKLKGITTVDQLDTPDITIGYFTGTPPETWLPVRLPKAPRRGVPGSGANAPVDEILSHRADVAPIDAVAWPDLARKVPGLVSVPAGDACLQSSEMATPVGMAIDKNQPEFLAWLRAVQTQVEPALRATELAVLKATD